MLDPDSTKIFDHHIRTKCNELKCMACGGNEWQDGELNGIPIVEIVNRESVFEKGLIPHVSKVCSNCGFVAFFSAQVVGLVGIGPRPSLS
jgi:predicted nucleic-acid-binding Zn-ribbon protein